MKNIDIATKTAAIALGLNTFLTLAKFILYFFSGSLAILAEAWHSLTDIATSALVFIAVKRTSRTARNQDNGGDNVVSRFEIKHLVHRDDEGRAPARLKLFSR